MRIENMTKETIKELPDVSLRNLKIRFVRMHERYFSDPEMKTAPMDDKIFYNKYMILRAEMKQRGIEFLEGAPLDKKINTRLFTKSVWGIDIAGMNEITIMKSYVAASGAFIKSPKSSKEIDVVIRNLEENRDERLEKAIEKELKTHTKKTPNFIYSPAGPDSSYIPMFDLVLSAREETKRINVAKKAEITKKTVPIEKPEETDDMISIPVGPACEVTATITIDKEQGITALYCGKVKKIRTFKFDKRVKAWTMATARAWIKEHKEKLEKYLAKKVMKKLSDAQRKECDVETALIRENTKKAKYPHKFEAAKFTHPNGHPRCIHCGDEERVDAKDKQLPCEKPDAGSRRFTKFTIIKIDKKKQMVGGVVYEPDEVDTQGDYATKEEIEKAMYRFMQKYATNTKRIKINHMGKKYFFPIIESFVPEQDTVKGGQALKKGTWWLMIKVTSDKIWKDIESGKLTGFSMGGTAKA